MTVSPTGRFLAKDRPTSRDVIEFHTNSDLDGSPKAQHHTLGPGPNQAAPGNHSHDAGASSGLSGYSPQDHNHDTVYEKANVPWIAASPLLNSWINYGGVFGNAAYRKVGDVVYLRGLVKNGTVNTTATGNIFVLPAGYTPPTQIIFSVPINAGALRLDIFPDGSVRAMSSYVSGGTNAFLSLENILFSTL